MHFLSLVVSAILLHSIKANNLMKLIVDFTLSENTARIRVCNLVTCWGHGNMDLVKEISNNFRCYIAVHPFTKPISQWFINSDMQLFVVDLSCSQTQQFLIEAEAFGLFNGNLVWLVVNSKESARDAGLIALNGTSAVEAFRGVDVTAMSQVNIASEVSDNEYEITSLYKLNPDDALKHENIGYWTAKEGMVFTAASSVAVRRRNMEGRVFRASIVITNDDSMNHFHDLVDNHVDNPSKLNMVIWDLAIQGVNARIELLVARKWGEKVNGSFNGMVGHIARGEAEFAVSPLLMTYERMEVLSYIAMTGKFRFKFIFLSPPLSYKNNIYLLPFDIHVWCACLALFLFSVVLLHLVAVYEVECATQEDMKNNPMVRPLTKSWTDIIMLNTGTICQQDVLMEPKGIGGRIVIFCVKIAVLFLYVSYSGAILVLLRSSDRSITNLAELDKSNLKLGVHDTPYSRFYFKGAADPMRRRIASKVMVKNFVNLEEGLNKVKSGLFAYHVDINSGYLVALRLLDETEKCRLQELDEYFMPSGNPLVAMRKNLPFTEIMTIMFKKLHEVGLVKRVEHRRIVMKPSCQKNKMTYVSVGIVDCEATFTLLASGIFVSVVIWILEICFSKYENRCRRRNEQLRFIN